MTQGNIISPFGSFLPQPATPLADLSTILGRLARKNFYYYRKTIYLDGMTFVECSFENCEFIIKTGNFSIINCRIYGPDTKFRYGDRALKIAQLYELMNTSIHNRIVFPNLFPKVDADGRVTI
jgi:hypothetical protein